MEQKHEFKGKKMLIGAYKLVSNASTVIMLAQGGVKLYKQGIKTYEIYQASKTGKRYATKALNKLNSVLKTKK